MSDANRIYNIAIGSTITIIIWWIAWFLYTPQTQDGQALYFFLSLATGPTIGLLFVSVIQSHGSHIITILREAHQKQKN